MQEDIAFREVVDKNIQDKMQLLKNFQSKIELTRAKDNFSLVESLASNSFGAQFISCCTAKVTFMIFHEHSL